MIEAVDINKVFNQGKPNEFRAIRDLTLSIRLGEFTVVTGPSGSGKTTLLSLLGAMSRPTSGRIYLSGREITSLPERFLAETRRRSFGFIFQSLNLIRGVSALENVMLPAYPSGAPHAALRRRAVELLELLGLGERCGAKIESLSGGEAQRVAIARALVNDPQIIIADEPTAHLDTPLATELLGILARLNREGRTVIVTSHDPAVYASPVVNRTVELHDGALVQPPR